MFWKMINKIRTVCIFFMIKVFQSKVVFLQCPALLSSWSVFDTDKKSTVKVGKKLAVRKNSLIECKEGGRLVIGNHVFFNRECMVTCLYKIKIGDRCIFGPNVKIYDHDHGFKNHQVNMGAYSFGSVEIGADSWIGTGCIILRNTKIGKGCVIGAGSVVKGEIPDHTIVKPDRKLKVEYNRAE